VAVLLAAFLVPLGAHAVAGATGGDRPVSARFYVVRGGDTLWSIGEHLAGPGSDPRPVIDELVSLNHLRGFIEPGERLRLP
jgi:LysM domain